MRLTVLGGSGEMGALVADRLEARGHQVRRASRTTAVDVRTGAGLAEAFSGSEVVLDCLNVASQARRVAVPFFTEATSRITQEARRAGVPHLVVLSIVNVADPAPRRFTGYYAAKAAQEAGYHRAGVPVTLVRTTAWFSLARTFLDLAPLGPVRLVPSMRLQPVHPHAAAELLADVAEGPPPPVRRLVELAGPQVLSSAEMARRLAETDGMPGRVLPLPVPGAMGRALLPGPHVPTDRRTLADWLAERAAARA